MAYQWKSEEEKKRVTERLRRSRDEFNATKVTVYALKGPQGYWKFKGGGWQEQMGPQCVTKDAMLAMRCSEILDDLQTVTLEVREGELGT